VIRVDRYARSSRPAVRLGVDFGAGILVVGIPDQDGRGFRTLEFPGWSQEMQAGGDGGPVHGIPVLIHYRHDGGLAIGGEAGPAACSDQPSAVRWIRKYLIEESPVRIPAGTDRRITFREAATDFLGAVLGRTAREHPGHLTAVFSLPPDAPEWYAGWLGSVAHTAGMSAWDTLGEHAAAAAGYGLSVGEGGMFLVIRCDETELAVSVVRCEGSSGPSRSEDLRVAGEACDDTGCRAFDGWIARHMLAVSRTRCTGLKAQRIYDGITGRISEVHQQLAAAEEAVLDIADPFSGTTIPARISRDDIGRILADRGFPSVLERTISRALAAARAHGCEETPVAVMMIGRGSAIPAVQELVKKQFAGVPVLCDHPFDAIARGAALYMPRAQRPERIRNDYALRYWDPSAREHRYRFLVRSGTRYPSAGQVARITISAAYDGQTRLGIPLYEISTSPDIRAPALELVSDPAGGIRLAGPAEDAGDGSRPVLVNGRSPTLLVADPPAVKGEPRLELTFMLDAEKQLMVTARDLLTGILVKKDAPVHRLT